MTTSPLAPHSSPLLQRWYGQALENLQGFSQDAKVLWALRSYFACELPRAWWVFLAFPALGVLQGSIPWVLKTVIDALDTGRHALQAHPQAHPDALSTLVLHTPVTQPLWGGLQLPLGGWVLLSILLLFGVQGLLFIINRTLQGVGVRSIQRYREALFARLMAWPQPTLAQHPIGTLTARLNGDMDGLGELFTTNGFSLFSELTLAACLLLGCWQLHAPLASITTLAVVFTLSGGVFLVLRSRYWNLSLRGSMGQLAGQMHETLSQLAVVQQYQQVTHRLQVFQTQNKEVERDGLKTIFYDYSLSAFAELGQLICTLSVLGYGIAQWVQHPTEAVGGLGAGATTTQALTLGVLISFIAATQRVFTPIENACQKLTLLQGSLASAHKLHALGELLTNPAVELAIRQAKTYVKSEQEAQPPMMATELPVFECRHLSYAYGQTSAGQASTELASPLALKDVSFTLYPNDKVALLGGSGSGKSTLVKLLTRVLPLQTGEVLFQGQPLAEVSETHLRHQCIYINQEEGLLNRSIAENVTLLDAETAQACRATPRYQQALTALFDASAPLPAWLTHPQATPDPLPPSSTGEAQLLQFGRIFYHNPPCLILDEATAHLDVQTEHRLQQALLHAFEGRTVLTIAHRPGTLAGCNRWWLMDAGQLLELNSLEEALERLKSIQ
ncbi:MAG: ATP-binding cassette domain-containing protein [Vampirovibrionales bacterium]